MRWKEQRTGPQLSSRLILLGRSPWITLLTPYSILNQELALQSLLCPPHCHLLTQRCDPLRSGRKASGSSSMSFSISHLQFPLAKAQHQLGQEKGRGLAAETRQGPRLSGTAWGQRRLGAGAVNLVLGLPFFLWCKKRVLTYLVETLWAAVCRPPCGSFCKLAQMWRWLVSFQDKEMRIHLTSPELLRRADTVGVHCNPPWRVSSKQTGLSLEDWHRGQQTANKKLFLKR